MIVFTPFSILFVLVTVPMVLMVLGTVFNLLTVPRLENASTPVVPLRVSLLIPARNEAKNLRILMPMLAKMDYPNLEILLLDDNSEDATSQIIEQAAGPAQLLVGRPLPQGWLGKNWACAQLAAKATGDILLFCDADVRIGPKAISATVGMMQAEGWDALTGMPKQILGTWSEKAVIPILLFMPILGWLPIAWIPKLPFPLLSVGCGQWFAFTRALYESIGGHTSVKNEIVEDMALGRLVKEHSGILGVTLIAKYLSVRMYTDFNSLWEGFTKNLNYLTGTNWLRPILILILFVLLNILPWGLALIWQKIWLIPFFLWLTSRLLSALTFREPLFGWLWSPVGTLLIPLLCIRSWWGFRHQSLQWKGRNLDAAFANGKGNV